MPTAPTSADFSHPALARLFDVDVFGLLEEVEKAFTRIEEAVDGSERFLGHCFLKKDMGGLNLALSTVAPSSTELSEDDDWWRDAKREAGLFVPGCEVCRHHRTQEAHILADRYLRTASGKWKRYGKHPINIMRLCPNHHEAIDRNAIARKDRRRFSRLFKGRRFLFAELRRSAAMELKTLHKVQDRFDRAAAAIDVAAKKELARLTEWIEDQG